MFDVGLSLCSMGELANTRSILRSNCHKIYFVLVQKNIHSSK